MTAIKLSRKTQENHGENGTLELKQLQSTPYNAELSYTLCINFLHRRKMSRLELQLADSYIDTHKFQMIILTEAMKVAILFQKNESSTGPLKILDRSEWSTVAICQS